MPTLALNLIVKDELDDVKRILNDYRELFDEIVVAVDMNYAEFEKLADDKVKIFRYNWISDFANKRNFVASKTESDYYMRIDCDDEIINPENLRATFDSFVKSGGTLLYTMYDYAKDEYGNVMTKHWRETIVKNDGNLYWNKSVHENLLPKDKNVMVLQRTDDIKINHRITFDHHLKSFERNFQILLDEYERDKDTTDPRTIAYLGRMLFGMGKKKEARFFLEKHIQLSGWDDDRCLSWCMLSDLHRMEKRYDDAIASAYEAISEKPEWCLGYFKVADAYFDKSQFKKALSFYETGMGKPRPDTMLLLDETEYTWKPLVSIAFSYFQISEFKKAMIFFERAEKFVKEMPVMKDNRHLFERAYTETLFVEHLTWMAKLYEDTDKDKIKDLLLSIPDEFLGNEIVIGLKKIYLPPKIWGEKDVVFLCGAAAEPWSPKSVDGGIGGSEEAVIHIARELSGLGWNVTVYNDCDIDEGIHDGVEYKDLTKFNTNDKFNIFVSWRKNVCPYVDAKHKAYWIHDLPQDGELTEEFVRLTDRIFVLSEYHKSLLPEHAKKKAFITRNGVNIDDFKGISANKVANRIIYASSYDRGLEDILKGWKAVKTEVPDAELHVYYGWNTYDKYLKDGLFKDKGAWKDRICELLKQEGVFEHGRVGHKELAREYAKASIFAYPCHYAGEIQCIALTKAIISGCLPVTNDHPIFKERNTVGVVATDENFIPELIKTLKRNRVTLTTPEGYLDKFSWKTVANEWSELFHKTPETIIGHRVMWMRDVVPVDAKIIDIGCAEGYIWKDRPNVTSVDLDDHGLNNFIKAPAHDIPVSDKSFDYAILGEILEHVPDPKKVIKEAARVAKKVVITVPNEYEWGDVHKPFASIDILKKTKEELLEIAPERYRTYVKPDDADGLRHLYHIRYYNEKSLADEIRNAGYKDFEVVKIREGLWSHVGAVICV